MIIFVNKGFVESSSGREDLYINSINLIKENYLMPKGVGYYQYVTGGNYPHNVILDLLITFGIITIPIIFCFIIAVVIKYKKSQTTFRLIFSTLLIFITARLTFSGNFWSEQVLWILIGFLVSTNIDNNVSAVVNLYKIYINRRKLDES